MFLKNVSTRIKILFTQRLTRRVLIFFIAIIITGSLVIGVLAKEGIGNLMEGYRLRKERIEKASLPNASDQAPKEKNTLRSIGETLGLLPESEPIKKAETVEKEETIDRTFTPEEEKILIEIPANITEAQGAITKIADLISEAIIDIILDASKDQIGSYLSNKIITDYPEVSKVISASEIQSALNPAIAEVFKTDSVKQFLDEELQKVIKEKISDLVGSDPSPAALEKAVNQNLDKIVMENLPTIMKKSGIFDPLTDKVYATLNGLSIFDTNVLAKSVSNITGDMTYSLDCDSDGAVEKTNGPTSSSSYTVSSACYYFKSKTASLTITKDGAGSASGFATITVANDNLTIASVNQSPIIDLSSSKTILEGSSVTLSGSRSIDPEGGSLSYYWIQTAGSSVSFSPGSATLSFTAPSLGQNEEGEDITSAVFTFNLTITDREGASASGSVSVTVVKENAPDPEEEQPRQYFAAVLSGSSLGKSDYLNRVMGGRLKQFSQDQTKYYFENNFKGDAFGVFISDNIKEMSVDITKSTFKNEFVTDDIEPEKPMGRGVYRAKNLEDRRWPEDLDSLKNFEFDSILKGPVFKTIQGFGSCRKSWHRITRCSCRCSGKSYLWDPVSRACGCGQ